MKYSNPRKKLIVDDWPIGGTARASAIFEVESHPKRGERVSRVTEKKDGTWGKPKVTTYAPLVRIVDGEDGRSYIASYGNHMVYVMRGDMKYSHESLFEGDEGYEDLVAMLKASA